MIISDGSAHAAACGPAVAAAAAAAHNDDDFASNATDADANAEAVFAPAAACSQVAAAVFSPAACAPALNPLHCNRWRFVM